VQDRYRTLSDLLVRSRCRLQRPTCCFAIYVHTEAYKHDVTMKFDFQRQAGSFVYDCYSRWAISTSLSQTVRRSCSKIIALILSEFSRSPLKFRIKRGRVGRGDIYRIIYRARLRIPFSRHYSHLYYSLRIRVSALPLIRFTNKAFREIIAEITTGI